jgi:hypothetical protein
MLQEPDFGLKQSALLQLAQIGTAEDIPLLLPLGDYWKSDRTDHYWAIQALASIRDRCGYDVNGPIKKSSVK